MSIPSSELAAALTDVRRAYRLLWAYQKRVVEYIQIIRERLGFEDWGSRSIFSNPGGSPRANWIWDLLPMADYESRASRHQDASKYQDGRWWDYPKNGDSFLYVRVRADTGIPEDPPADPNALMFKPVEDCATRLSAFVLVNRQNRNEIMRMQRACDECRKIRPSNRKERHPTISGIDIFGAEFDLAELPDEDALLRVMDEFKSAAGEALGLQFD